MAAIPFLGVVTKPMKNLVLQNKYGGECRITVVALLFPATSGSHSGFFFSLKNSIILVFLQLIHWRSIGNHLSPIFTLEEDVSDTCKVSYFSDVSYDLLVCLFLSKNCG